MTVPLKKSNLEEELTTADLAQSKRPAVATEMRPRPVPAEPVEAEHPETSPVNSQAVGDTTPLIPNSELDDLRGKWNTVQTAFVDEPRRAVEQADGLVAAAMKRLAEGASKSNGIGVTTYPPRIYESRCNDIVRFFIAYYRFEFRYHYLNDGLRCRPRSIRWRGERI
jgi:hypothetical protein